MSQETPTTGENPTEQEAPAPTETILGLEELRDFLSNTDKTYLVSAKASTEDLKEHNLTMACLILVPDLTFDLWEISGEMTPQEIVVNIAYPNRDTVYHQMFYLVIPEKEITQFGFSAGTVHIAPELRQVWNLFDHNMFKVLDDGDVYAPDGDYIEEDVKANPYLEDVIRKARSVYRVVGNHASRTFAVLALQRYVPLPTRHSMVVYDPLRNTTEVLDPDRTVSLPNPSLESLSDYYLGAGLLLPEADDEAAAGRYYGLIPFQGKKEPLTLLELTSGLACSVSRETFQTMRFFSFDTLLDAIEAEKAAEEETAEDA